MDDRIEQFRKMAQANPDDDLAHFALGNALFDAQRLGEAVPVLRHVIMVNAGYSRAYVLLASAQLALDGKLQALKPCNADMPGDPRGELMR